MNKVANTRLVVLLPCALFLYYNILLTRVTVCIILLVLKSLLICDM